MRNILKKLLILFVVPKVIAWVRRRYARPGPRSY